MLWKPPEVSLPIVIAAAPFVDDGVVDPDVLGRAVDAEPIGVAPGLQAERIVIGLDVRMNDLDPARGVDVNPIGGWTAPPYIVSDHEAVDDDVVRVKDLHSPEAGPLQREPASIADVIRVLNQ
jgi:hypothetical protein